MPINGSGKWHCDVDIVPFSVIPKTPSLTVEPSNSTLETGTAVTLTCATESIGSVTYTFYDEDVSVQSGGDSTYDLPSTATSDTGSYSCVATINGVASLESNVHNMTIVGE